MSNEKHHIDKLFKDTLSNGSLKTSKEDWEVISAAINPNKKKSFLWLWISMGFAAAIFGFWCLNYCSKINSKFAETSKKNEKHIVISNNNESIEIKAKQPLSLKENKKTPKEEPLNKNNPTINSPTSKAPVVNLPITKTPVSSSTINKQPVINVAINNTSINNLPTAKTLVDDKLINNPTIVKSPVGIPPIDDKLTNSPIVVKTPNDKSKKDSLEGKPPVIKTPKFGLDSTKSQITIAKTPFTKKWRIGLSSGAVIGFKHTSATKAELDEFVKRSNADKGKLSPTIGITGSYSFKKFKIETGINSSNLTFHNPHLTYIIYDSFPVYDPQGKLIGYGKRNYRDTVLSKNTTSKISTIQIPIQFNYAFFQSAKIGIHGGAGINIVYNYHQAGTTIRENLLPVNPASRYNSKFNLQYTILAGMDYRIKGNWIVQTDFMFRMQQNTIEKRTNYKTKLNQFNLKGTLYYEF